MTEGDVVPIFLTVDDVLALHAEQISLFGGARGIRDCNALESAIAQPLATFDGEFLHGDLFEMAAAYAFHIAENQAFVDGNKRAALNAALVFLDINGWVVLDPDSRLFDAMLELANKHLDKQAFGRLLKSFRRDTSMTDESKDEYPQARQGCGRPWHCKRPLATPLSRSMD